MDRGWPRCEPEFPRGSKGFWRRAERFNGHYWPMFSGGQVTPVLTAFRDEQALLDSVLAGVAGYVVGP